MKRIKVLGLGVLVLMMILIVLPPAQAAGEQEKVIKVGACLPFSGPVATWGRNLTDKLYRTNAIAFFGDETSRLGAPRTYGAEISINF